MADFFSFSEGNLKQMVPISCSESTDKVVFRRSWEWSGRNEGHHFSRQPLA